MATRIFGLRKATLVFAGRRGGVSRAAVDLDLFPPFLHLPLTHSLLLPLTHSLLFFFLAFQNNLTTLRDQREDLQKRLKELLKALRKAKLVCGRPMVIKARVPIIKCELNFGVAVDISLGAVNGAAAVEYIQAQVIWG